MNCAYVIFTTMSNEQNAHLALDTTVQVLLKDHQHG